MGEETKMKIRFWIFAPKYLETGYIQISAQMEKWQRGGKMDLVFPAKMGRSFR